MNDIEISNVVNSVIKWGFESTYKELKFSISLSGTVKSFSFESTYKELKSPSEFDSLKVHSEVLSLPIRN